MFVSILYVLCFLQFILHSWIETYKDDGIESPAVQTVVKKVVYGICESYVPLVVTFEWSFERRKEMAKPFDDAVNIRKTLFQSPGVPENSKNNPNEIKLLLNKLQIDHDIETMHTNLQKDLHDQRMKQLRNMMKSLSDDDWKYPPVDKLIGLQ